jgi:predicted nucleic acid-binding protein
MRLFLLDASALVKRYAVEVGTPLLDHLFAQATPARLLCLTLGVAEVAATLVRKRNRGDLTLAAYTLTMAALHSEVLRIGGLVKLAADDPLILHSLPLLERHAINATDAVVLQTALDLAAALRASGNDLVLVATDRRLLQAARAEGVIVFDPETQIQTDLDVLLMP